MAIDVEMPVPPAVLNQIELPREHVAKFLHAEHVNFMALFRPFNKQPVEFEGLKQKAFVLVWQPKCLAIYFADDSLQDVWSF